VLNVDSDHSVDYQELILMSLGELYTTVVCVNLGKHNVYRMSAATSDEKEDWMKNIKFVHSLLFHSTV